MGQQPLDHRDPRRSPTIRGGRIAEAPNDGGAVRSVETRVHAVLAASPQQHLIVGGRGLQLLGREQVLDVHQTTVGQPVGVRYAFVSGMVVVEVVAFLVFTALPPAVGPDEEHPAVVRGALTDDEVIAGEGAGLVDEGRGARPAGIVEHRAVQRRQDALERVLVAHDDSATARKRSLRAAPRPSDSVPCLALSPTPRGESEGLCMVFVLLLSCHYQH